MVAEDRGSQLAAVTVALLALCWMSVCLRCYTMGFLLKRFFVEDWLAIVTLMIYTAYSTFCLLGVHYGLGAHVSDVPLADRPNALFYKWTGQVLYVILAALVKFIAGLLLIRLCSGKRWQRITLWTLLWVSGVYSVFYVFIVIFQCQPVQFYWYRYDPNSPDTGRCNGHLLATIPTYISFVISVVSDWILALIPVSIVWNAKMDRRSKVSVSCVLALGSIASMATIARIPYARQLLADPDYLYNFTDLAIWSTVEVGLGLTASSLATLKPLFRKLRILANTRNGSRPTPRYQSHPSSSRLRASQMFHSTTRNSNKLRKSLGGSPRMGDWNRIDSKIHVPAESYEMSLATESSSVRTTITASPPPEEQTLTPPPPSHQHPSYRRTSVSFRISHVDLEDMTPENMV
ncbi:cation-transporting ATPase 4 [Xylariales sp. AK1849]|nr:cation-transporting ATPase 4 [Xylariales sp. AK1849]